MWRRTPDWLIYFIIVALIYFNAQRYSDYHEVPQPPPPPELGPMLPSESPRDTTVLVELDAPTSGAGTAFAIDKKGHWLTARHVVDGCDEVGIRLGNARGLKVHSKVTKGQDTAVLTSKWTREPLPTDLESDRRVGEYGYFFGFPQGKPGEAAGTLLGRHKMITRGRYNTEEPILAWTEIGRTLNLRGTLGGLSGGPVLDQDGEVIGVVAAESPRRGRIYTVAPRNLQELVPDTDNDTAPRPIALSSYGVEADRYRRSRRIAQVVCLVK